MSDKPDEETKVKCAAVIDEFMDKLQQVLPPADFERVIRECLRKPTFWDRVKKFFSRR